MTKLQTEKYLKKLIKHARVLYEAGKVFDGDIVPVGFFSSGRDDIFSIQIYKGVRFISEKLNLKLYENRDRFEDKNYIWVEFEGCRFFGLEDKAHEHDTEAD